MNNKRTTRYVAVMITLLTALIITYAAGHGEAFNVLALGMLCTSYVYWVPEDKNKKPPVKGTIQYDCKNYDVPAMRIVFDEEPLNLINYNEVTFKVDRDADLSGMEWTKRNNYRPYNGGDQNV